ncbi:hypothetical protein BaRGS_00026120, partial [Batillaria attramentaria]
GGQIGFLVDHALSRGQIGFLVDHTLSGGQIGFLVDHTLSRGQIGFLVDHALSGGQIGFLVDHTLSGGQIGFLVDHALSRGQIGFLVDHTLSRGQIGFLVDHALSRGQIGFLVDHTLSRGQIGFLRIIGETLGPGQKSSGVKKICLQAHEPRELLIGPSTALTHLVCEDVLLNLSTLLNESMGYDLRDNGARRDLSDKVDVSRDRGGSRTAVVCLQALDGYSLHHLVFHCFACAVWCRDDVRTYETADEGFKRTIPREF